MIPALLALALIATPGQVTWTITGNPAAPTAITWRVEPSPLQALIPHPVWMCGVYSHMDANTDCHEQTMLHGLRVRVLDEATWAVEEGIMSDIGFVLTDDQWWVRPVNWSDFLVNSLKPPANPPMVAPVTALPVFLVPQSHIVIDGIPMR